MNTLPSQINQRFAQDVEEGLSLQLKKLPSKYFYDKKGDELFVKIMHCEEYYPTDCELEILKEQSIQIIEACELPKDRVNVIELGAGDGLKTRELLKALVQQRIETRYMPVDISANAVEGLVSKLKKEIPQVETSGQVGDYFEILNQVNARSERSKLILFLGSTIGNMMDEVAQGFVSTIAENMKENDRLLIGFDLKKEPDIVRAAYNDQQGFTRAFNMNLLERINHELGGNFDLNKFKHYPVYNPQTGTAKSYLISLCDQEVYIEALQKTFQFEAWESIHTEISQKYSKSRIEAIARASGLQIERTFSDQRAYFADVLFKKSST